MSGQVKYFIDTIIRVRGKGNPVVERDLRVKLILKGVQLDKFTAETQDDAASLALIRAVAKDLEAAAACRVHAAHFSLPVSELHLRAWKRDHDWGLRTMSDLATGFLAVFPALSVGAQDAHAPTARSSWSLPRRRSKPLRLMSTPISRAVPLI